MAWVHIDVDHIKKETDKAFLCVIDEEEIWLPKSQISDVADYEEGDRDVSMSISEFIAGEKGLG